MQGLRAVTNPYIPGPARRILTLSKWGIGTSKGAISRHDKTTYVYSTYKLICPYLLSPLNLQVSLKHKWKVERKVLERASGNFASAEFGLWSRVEVRLAMKGRGGVKNQHSSSSIVPVYPQNRRIRVTEAGSRVSSQFGHGRIH